MREYMRGSLRPVVRGLVAAWMLVAWLSLAAAAKEAAPVLTGQGVVPSAILQAVSRTAVEAGYAGETGVVITPAAPPHAVTVRGSWRLEAKPPTGFRHYGLITSGVLIHLENGAVRTVYCVWSVARQATVRRGQAVTLEAVVGAVRITVPAIALEDGCTGQVIRVQDIQTHHTKTGRVVDAGRVALIISAPKAQP